MQKFALLSQLHHDIPVSKQMQTELLQLTDSQVQLKLPLAANRNHKGTIFGGSLYSGCALACYALFLNSLRSRGFETNDIVIGDGQIRYLRPVTRDAVIIAAWPSEAEKNNFFKTLEMKSRARINIDAFLEEDGQIACQFTGRFVATQA